MIKFYDLNSINSTLSQAKKLYCSDNLNYGLKLLPAKLALAKRYIQANNDHVIQFLIIDLDHDNPLIWEDVNLAAPNFIVRDEIKNTSHLIYAIETAIPKDYINGSKALNYFAKIQQEYTRLLKGDPNYVNVITKNPNHKGWVTTNPHYFYAYTLDELADYVILPERITKKSAIGEGRNCWLFDTVRKWAYREVLFYKNHGANYQDFYQVVLNRLEKINIFPTSTPLDFNEIKAIAKSISKWTWAKFTAEKFSQIQKARRRKSGQQKEKQKSMRLISYE